MNKKDIKTRDDVFLLVSSFYEKVKKDTVLGPFFNDVIQDWEAHLNRLTTFWESSLFMTRKLEHKYQGDPLKAHVKADAENNNSTVNTVSTVNNFVFMISSLLHLF